MATAESQSAMSSMSPLTNYHTPICVHKAHSFLLFYSQLALPAGDITHTPPGQGEVNGSARSSQPQRPSWMVMAQPRYR